MSGPDQPSRKLSPTEFITRQVHDHLTGDGFRAQLYDIVRHVLAAQGHNLTLEDVRAVVREELADRPAGGGTESLTAADVTALVRDSVLSDQAMDVGGAIDAKLGHAAQRITRTLEARITGVADELEEQLLAAIERRPAAVAPVAPAAPAGGGRRPEGLGTDISDALLQDIYRAVREEVATLRKTLVREAREAAAAAAREVATAAEPPLTPDAVRAVAAAVVADHELAQQPRLTEDTVRAVARAALAEVEATRAPTLTANDVRALARECITAADAARPPGLTAHDARVVADEAIATALANRPAPLTRADVDAAAAAAAEAAVAGAEQLRPAPLTRDDVAALVGEVAPPGLDAAAVQGLIDEAIAALEAARPAPLTPADVWRIAGQAAPVPLDEDGVRALVREVLAGQPAPAPVAPGIDADAVRALVAEGLTEVALEPAGLDADAVRALVREVLDTRWADGAPDAAAVAIKELLDAALAQRPDELAVRTLARTEMAEIIAEWPHPHTDEQVVELATEAAAAVLADRIEHGEAPVTPSDVRRLAREILASEGATREELLKLVRRDDAPPPAVPTAVIERAVQEQVAAVIGELSAAGGGPSAAELEQLVRSEVDAALRDAGLPAGEAAPPADPALVADTVRAEAERRGFVTAEQVRALVQESVGAGGGGGEDPAAVSDPVALKRFVREIVEAVALTREDAEKLLRRGGTRRL